MKEQARNFLISTRKKLEWLNQHVPNLIAKIRNHGFKHICMNNAGKNIALQEQRDSRDWKIRIN